MRTTRLQRFLLAGAAALAIVLAATFRRVPRPPREPGVPAASVEGPAGVGKATTLLSGFDYSESSGGKSRFRIHADRTVGYAAGAGLPSTWYRLEKVALNLTTADGQPILVRSDSADYDPRTKAMKLSGNVEGSNMAGATVHSAAADFDPSRERLTIPGEVRFERGPVSGRASSGVYSTRDRVLELAGPVTGAGTGPDAPFDALRADAATYRAAEGGLALAGAVRANRGPDTLSCNRMDVHLTPENHVDTALAIGAVSGRLVSGGAAEDYTADTARSTFDAGGKISAVELAGGPATITVPATRQAPARRLAAPHIRMAFASERLASADADGRPRLDRTVALPSGAPFTESITADRAHADFGPDGALAGARFDGNVVGVSTQGNSASPEADYRAATDTMVLVSSPAQEAELDAPKGKLVARRIEIDGRSGVVTGVDSARAYLRPGDANPSTPGFLASSKKPTHARAQTIVLDDRNRTAHLSGDAALWQETNALFAETIDLRDSDRSLRADRAVRLAGRSAADGKKPPEATSVTADRMRYTEAAKTATFEGNVVASRGAQNGRGDSGEAHFDADNRIDRTVLDGGVTFDDPATGRSGSGTHAVDEPKAGVTRLDGSPAVARDAQGNVVKGAVLTFRKDSGSVEVRAGEGGRIESVYQTHGR